LKLAVIGSNDWSDYALLHRHLLSLVYTLPKPTLVINNRRPDACKCPDFGATEMADWFAHCLAVPVIANEARRNSSRPEALCDPLLFFKQADMCIAFWNGQSPGTRHLIEQLRTAGKRVGVVSPGTGIVWEPQPLKAPVRTPQAVMAARLGPQYVRA
jgi:hypothetical protein